LSIIVVEEEAGRSELARMVGGQPWVANAPLSMVFCIDFYRVKRWASMFDVDFCGERAFGSFLIAYADIMCAAQNVVVLAESLELGSVYIGTIQGGTEAAREYFGMPEYVLPVMVLTLGCPKSVPRGIPKLSLEAIVHRERYAIPSDETIRDGFEAKYGRIEGDVDAYLERAFIEAVEADKQQDESWVEDVKERMERLSIKSNAEFLFKLRYPTPLMARMNHRMLKAFRAAGFDFGFGR
jgi:hypothetical protein